MNRKMALATAATATLMATSSALAVGANFGLFGLSEAPTRLTMPVAAAAAPAGSELATGGTPAPGGPSIDVPSSTAVVDVPAPTSPPAGAARAADPPPGDKWTVPVGRTEAPPTPDTATSPASQEEGQGAAPGPTSPPPDQPPPTTSTSAPTKPPTTSTTTTTSTPMTTTTWPTTTTTQRQHEPRDD